MSPFPARIPTYLTALLGRSRELEELAPVVQAHRLTSLVGAGGSGKTRLAAAVATASRDGFEGVGWIELAPLSDPAFLVHHVLASLGIREGPGQTPDDALAQLIGSRRILLVLDNCEHVLDAASSLADGLLRECPELRILTTTRQALGIAGEKIWPVPPLGLPRPGGATSDSDAVRLFVERARAVLPDFDLEGDNGEAVADICRRVDGLPLGIELAAARIRLMPPLQLARRLDDILGILTSGSRNAVPRHRTLRALIDWSYRLLSPDERILLQRLTVFSSGFTLEAAERIAGHGELHESRILDLLAALVEKSVVVVRPGYGEARYALLQAVREYARERLDAGPSEGVSGIRECCAGEADPADLVGELRRRHAVHFLERSEEAARHLRGPTQLEWLTRVEGELDEIRAALGWSMAVREGEIALRLCVALGEVWRIRGHPGEGRRWTEAALALPGGADVLRAKALTGAAVFGRMQGDHDAFRRHLRASEPLARSAGDLVALAEVFTQMGVAHRDQRELESAASRLEEALILWRTAGDPRGLSLALGVRSSIALQVGDVATARLSRLEALEISRRARDPKGEALALIGLGEVARLAGDPKEALDLNRRSLELFRSMGDNWQVGAVLQNMGWIAAETGRLADAHRAFSESIASFSPWGHSYGITLCLVGLARILHETGDSRSAAVALGTAAAETDRVGGRPAAPADAAAWDRTCAAVEAALNPEENLAARMEGAVMEQGRCIAWVQELLSRRFGPAVASATDQGQVPAGAAATSSSRGAPYSAEAGAASTTAAGATSTGGGTTLRIPHPTSTPTSTSTAVVAVADGFFRVVSEADLRVQALGPLQIHLGSEPLDGDAFGSSKPRELLLFLLCHPEGCTREQVGLAFWPDSPATHVKNSFHVTLHRLRKALGRPEWIEIVGERYRLHPSLRVDFDAARFQSEMENLKEAPVPLPLYAEPEAAGGKRGPGSTDGASQSPGLSREAGERLAAALDLYRGDFLEGEPVGDWHLDIRDHLRRLFLRGSLTRSRWLFLSGRLPEAAAGLEVLLARDRLNEEAARDLMLCYEKMGARPRALRLYENLSALLREDLDTIPDPTTTALYERIREPRPHPL